MNIAVPLDQFNINHVFFQEAIKNTIMNDSNFIRVIYSNDLCMLNGICIEFKLPILQVDKSFNKYKCTFDNKQSSEIIQAIYKLEYDILTKYGGKNKQPVSRISDQLKNGIIKVTNINSSSMNSSSIINTFIIKISGLWSTELEYGLTYKFAHG